MRTDNRELRTVFEWSTFYSSPRILYRLRPADHSRRRRLHPHASHRAISRSRAAASRRHGRLYRSQRPDRRIRCYHPLEQQINGAEGMKYITSSSTNDGVSTVTATFDLSRDPDLATVDIENRVNTASGRLPPPSSKSESPSPRPRKISSSAARSFARPALLHPLHQQLS